MADTYPIELDAADLMQAPPGTVRVGDEFHDPDYEFETCDACNSPYRPDGWHCCAENVVGDPPEHVLREWGHE